MPIACHPKRWWNFGMTEDQKKEIEPIFIEKFASVVYNLEVLKHYVTNTRYSSKIFINI